MGKKKTNEYNDFLDGEKLRDNAEIRTTLGTGSSTRQDISPPATRSHGGNNNKHAKNKPTTKNPPLTHFLCFPLVTATSRPQFEKGLIKLKNDLTTTNITSTKAIRPLGTLHLTLGVMSLDDTQLEKAKQHLQSLHLHNILRDISQTQLAEKAASDGTISENLNAAALPDADFLSISFHSLVPMKTPPQRTSILYAQPQDPTGRLYPFASALKQDFTKAGYVLDENRELILHATVIHTIYAKPKGDKRGRKGGRGIKDTIKHVEHKVSPHHHAHRHEADGAQGTASDDEDDGHDTPDAEESKNEGQSPDAKDWRTFDARDLIKEYQDFTWAENVRIDKVQICKMGAKKIWSGGGEGQGEMIDEEYEVVFEKGIYE